MFKGRASARRHFEPLYWPSWASLAIDKPRSGENLGTLLRWNCKDSRLSNELALRASPITLDGVRSLSDLQTSKGYVLGLPTSFGPHAVGKCRHHRGRLGHH